jgi:hypothetical protein
MTTILIALLLATQVEGSDPATFARRVAALDAADAERAAAVSPDDRARGTLKWLQALRELVEAIPAFRVVQPHHRAWIDKHEDWVFDDEIGGRWLISRSVLEKAHKDHAGSAVADEIAWFAVTNDLGGECEGYVPCYAHGLNNLYGDYLRASPRGAHRQEAFNSISELLRTVVTDLLGARAQPEYFNPKDDCEALLNAMRPLRAAVVAADGAKTETMTLIERVIKLCPAR